MAAFRPLLSKRAALSIAAASTTVVIGSSLFTPRLHLDSATPIGWESLEPEPKAASATIRYRRKPIYDEPTSYQKTTPEAAQPTLPESAPSEIRHPQTEAARQTTIDNLATHIRIARLFLHANVAATEDALNRGLDRVFEAEHNFTTTIANLKPAPETGEKLLPGAIYVAVATMGGSIMFRNRGLLLRGIGPIGLGLTAGWVLLPHTMQNVGDLVWKWEEKVPVVANQHLVVRGFLTQGAKEARDRGDQFAAWLENASKQSRETIEGWVQRTR